MSKLKKQFIEALAKRLGETEPKAIDQLTRICECMEPEHVIKLLQKVEKIEKKGGMLTRDGSRKKTRGGIFFHLCIMRREGKLNRAQRKYCFPQLFQQGKKE